MIGTLARRSTRDNDFSVIKLCDHTSHRCCLNLSRKQLICYHSNFDEEVARIDVVVDRPDLSRRLISLRQLFLSDQQDVDLGVLH